MSVAICSNLTLTNGTISYSPATTPVLEGAVAIHMCEGGYRLSGGVNRMCKANRTWSGVDSTCQGNKFINERSCL